MYILYYLYNVYKIVLLYKIYTGGLWCLMPLLTLFQ